MRIIKEKNIDISAQIMELDCQVMISVRKNESENVALLFESVFGVSVKKCD
jgi:hypothetical protein